MATDSEAYFAQEEIEKAEYARKHAESWIRAAHFWADEKALNRSLMKPRNDFV